MTPIPPRHLTPEPTRFSGIYDLRRPNWRRREWLLLGAIAFDSHTLGSPAAPCRVTVPAGEKTDFASIPRSLHAILPPDGPWGPAAIVHDYLYRRARCGPAADARPVSRREADAVFLEGMTDLRVGWATRHAMWLAVRLCGWAVYRPHV